MTENFQFSDEESFSRDIELSMKYLTSDPKLIYRFRQDIINSVPCLRAIHSRLNDKNSYKEFVKAINDDYRRMSDTLQNLNVTTLKTYLSYLSAKYFSNNMKEFAERKYDSTYRPSNNMFDVLNYDFDDCLQLYANDVIDRHAQLRIPYEKFIHSDPKAKAINDKTYLTNSEKIDEFESYLNRERKRGKLDTSKAEAISNVLVYLKGPISIIRSDIKYFEKELKSELSDSLIQLITQSKETGYYDRYKYSESKKLKQFDLESYINNSIELTSRQDALDSLSVTELFILNSFWQNRVTKEMTNYYRALFTLFDLDIVDKVLETDDPLSDVDDDTLRNELLKIRFLNIPTKDFFKKVTKYMKRKPENFINKDGKLSIDTNDFVEKIGNKYERYYNEFFNRNLNRDDTDLRNDIRYYSFLALPIIASYQLKSDVLLAPVSTQFEKIANSGIVIDDPDFADKIEEYKRNNNLLLFGIDGKFSFPTFIHMRYRDLERFYFGYNQSEKVPVYIGHNDFKNHYGERIAPQVITPISKKQTEIIKKLSRKKGLREGDKHLYQHLYYLANNNAHPDHFNGVERLYIDFSDGKFYQKDKDGNFVHIDINDIINNPTVFSPIATPNYSRTQNNIKYDFTDIKRHIKSIREEADKRASDDDIDI